MRGILKIIILAGGFMLIGNVRPASGSATSYRSSGDLPVDFMSMKISEFIKLSTKDLSVAAGKKLSLKESISFSVLKRSMKRSLRSHPDQTVKEYLINVHKKGKTKALVIILVVLALLIMIMLIVLSTMDINFGGG